MKQSPKHIFLKARYRTVYRIAKGERRTAETQIIYVNVKNTQEIGE